MKMHGTKITVNAVTDDSKDVNIYISNRVGSEYTIEVDGKNYNIPCYYLRFAIAFLDSCTAGDPPIWKAPVQSSDSSVASQVNADVVEEPEESEGLDA